MCFFYHMQLKVSNMFKLGTSDAKINVTTWRGKVQIHVRKYFQSKYDKKLYPSKQGIALTVQEWTDLKKQISVIDECIECSEYMLQEEAGRMKPKLNRRNVRQLQPPDAYNANADMPFQFQEEQEMSYQHRNCIYDNPVGFQHQKEVQQFNLSLPDTYSEDANIPFQFQGNELQRPAYQRQYGVSEVDERENKLQRLSNDDINELLKLSRAQQDKNGV